MKQNRVSLSLAKRKATIQTIESPLNYQEYAVSADYGSKGDDEYSNELEDIDNSLTPIQYLCGHDRRHCCSSRLHGSIFVLAIIFMLFYLLGTVGAWTFVGLSQKISNLQLFLALSVTCRLVGSIFILVGALTRSNCWLLIHIIVSVISFGLFLMGTLLHKPLLGLTAFGILFGDIILFFLLYRFMNENRHQAIIIAEKKKKYNQAVQKLLQATDEEDLVDAEDDDLLEMQILRDSANNSLTRIDQEFPKLQNVGFPEKKLPADQQHVGWKNVVKNTINVNRWLISSKNKQSGQSDEIKDLKHDKPQH